MIQQINHTLSACILGKVCNYNYYTTFYSINDIIAIESTTYNECVKGLPIQIYLTLFCDIHIHCNVQ